MNFAVVKLGLAPSEFWKLTFAEWIPLMEAILGKTEKPLTKAENNSMIEEYLAQFKKG